MLNIIIGVLIVWSALLTIFVYIQNKMIGKIVTSVLTLQEYVKEHMEHIKEKNKTTKNS